MEKQRYKIVIIGGGLSGLYAASFLQKQSKEFILLEARSRLGGRILCPEYHGYFPDMGPSWFWPAINPKVNALVNTLDLERFPQFESGLGRLQGRTGEVETIGGYPMDPPGFRLKGGMNAIIEKLAAQIPREKIRLNHPVCELERRDKGIRITVGQLDEPPQCVVEAEQVILALPPRLAAGSMLFTPDLSHGLTQAMLKAGTWMAGQAKFFALYDHAPWRDSGFSGQGFSMCGPVGEFHDGSSDGQGPYGLTGFLSIPALRRRDEEFMVSSIVNQLGRVFGPQAQSPLKVYYKDWAREVFSATDYDKRSAHAHPEFYPPSGEYSIWEKRLHFAGTETAEEMGGYLEGALVSGARAAMAVVG